MLNVSETSLAIADRFFRALDILADEKRIRGLQTFTRRYGLNYGNMNTLKNNRDRRQVKTEYLAFLCEGYGVSAEWLLLGEGPVFRRTTARSEVSPLRQNAGEE